MNLQDYTEFPVNELTFTIATSSVANVVAGLATIDVFYILNTSTTGDSYVGVYDTLADAETATLADQYRVNPGEQLTLNSPFVSNTNIGQQRTIYAVASTPNSAVGELNAVIITPMEY